MSVAQRILQARVGFSQWARGYVDLEKTVRVRTVDVKLGISSQTELFRANTYSTKEPETLDWIDSELRAGDIVFDIGANIGLYSLYAAKKCPQAQVFAFEPESSNFSRLCQNIRRNGLSNVIPCGVALASKTTFNIFYVGSHEVGSALHSFGRPSDFLDNQLGKETGKFNQSLQMRQGALGSSLDTMIEQYGLPSPQLLKIDVDGNEEEILSGAKNLLRSPQLRSLLIEICSDENAASSRLEDLIGAAGFKLTKKSAWVYENGSMRSQNCIFTRVSSETTQ